MQAKYKALAEAKARMLKDPNIQSVSLGVKYKGGKPIEKEAVVFAVKKKKPKHEMRGASDALPLRIQGVETDVQERVIYAPPRSRLGWSSREFKSKKRPCPPGYSVGHHLITAGTLGFWGRRMDSDDYLMFSNNHVLANSNACRPGDPIYQPGPHDGGTSSDRIGLLDDYVEINWGGGENGGCNLFARALQLFKRSAIKQPNPNLVDAAMARVLHQSWVEHKFPGETERLKGVRDLQLGDSVKKPGRTTEWTFGAAEGVDVMARVNYGNGRVAIFDDQIEFRANDPDTDFSAGGDSGSAIISIDGYLGALLFAGGGGVTVGCRIGHVMTLLNARL